MQQSRDFLQLAYKERFKEVLATEAGNRKCISAANRKQETRNAFLPETRNGKLEMHFRRKLEIKNQWRVFEIPKTQESSNKNPETRNLDSRKQIHMRTGNHMEHLPRAKTIHVACFWLKIQTRNNNDSGHSLWLRPLP